MQQESVSLLNTSQETGWPGPNVRQTLPRYSDSQQESISFLENSQEPNWPEPLAPRRTLPRPPTWPRINRTGQPSGGDGKSNNQGIGKSRQADAQEGSQRAARWRLPSSISNKENAGQSAAKERDLRHHLSEVSKQVSKMPTSISKLLEEAVRFLDSSQASKQGTLKDSLDNILNTVKELGDQKYGNAGDNLVAEHVQSLQLVTESLQKEGERVRGIEEKQEILTKELVGLKDEMKKNLEVLERLCQQKDVESRQQVDQAIDRRRVAAMRRTSRPLLLNRTGKEIPDQHGLTPSPMILPRPGVIAPGNNPSPKPIVLKARNNASISSGSSVPSKVAR